VTRGLFLDRDGTVIEECGYLSDPALVRLLPGVVTALAALASEGWKLIVVSNQSGVGRGWITTRQMEEVQSRFLNLMKSSRIPITDSYVCIHTPEDLCQCRKPSPFLLQRAAAEHGLDLGSSWMIGDREGDILCGRNAGCSTMWLRNDVFPVADDLPTFVANDWGEIYLRLGSLKPRRGLPPVPR
jgi:D-glycero-D-manno-heptose 1,7-bisphosphate phosphatase